MPYTHFENEISGDEEPSFGKFMLHMGIIGILIAVFYLAIQ